MDVRMLAEALAKARRVDGAVSMQDLNGRLRRVGLDELARAVETIARRPGPRGKRGPAAGKTPWN